MKQTHYINSLPSKKEDRGDNHTSITPSKKLSLNHGILFHDFKNLLMAMQAELSLLRLKVDPSVDVLKYVDRIESKIEHGNAMIHRVLRRARKDNQDNNTIDLNPLIKRAMDAIRWGRKNVTILSKFDSEGAYIDADAGQIEIILLNLLDNAMDAMPYGGTLTVITRRVEAVSVKAKWPKLDHKSYIRMTVSDSGVGMDPQVTKRVFEPFYTTKTESKGNGLGLTSAQGVVADLNGHIKIHSKKGIGTTVKILFPTART